MSYNRHKHGQKPGALGGDRVALMQIHPFLVPELTRQLQRGNARIWQKPV